MRRCMFHPEHCELLIAAHCWPIYIPSCARANSWANCMRPFSALCSARHLKLTTVGYLHPWKSALSKHYTPGLCFCFFTRERIIRYLSAHCSSILPWSTDQEDLSSQRFYSSWSTIPKKPRGCSASPLKKVHRRLTHSHWDLLDTYYVHTRPSILWQGM